VYGHRVGLITPLSLWLLMQVNSAVMSSKVIRTLNFKFKNSRKYKHKHRLPSVVTSLDICTGGTQSVSAVNFVILFQCLFSVPHASASGILLPPPSDSPFKMILVYHSTLIFTVYTASLNSFLICKRVLSITTEEYAITRTRTRWTGIVARMGHEKFV
jgi:hypothetical protein